MRILQREERRRREGKGGREGEREEHNITHSGKKWGIAESPLPGNVGILKEILKFGEKLYIFVHKNI